MSKFLFANEEPSLKSFFLVAARRTAILFPLAGVVSVTAITVVKILLLISWLFSGDWKSRIKIYKQNPIFLILIILALWTLIGVIRCAIIDPNMIMDALKHWWGRHPFLVLFLLSTFYIDKETRIKAISVFNIAMVIFCVNLLLVRNGIIAQDQPACFLLFRTIATASALVLWSIFWVYYPFTLRNIKLMRYILPKNLLLAMNVAARTSPLDLIAIFLPSSRKKCLLLLSIPLVLIRWGVVASIAYFVFVLNPSRTAQLSMLALIVVGLIMWNWRKGIPIIIILVACIFMLALSNKFFLKKWFATYDRIQDVVSQDTERFNKTSKDRHWILMKLIPAIKEKPIIGYGLDLDFQIVGGITEPRNFMHTHCEFTQIAIQFGLVGMGLFILLLVVMFWNAANLPPPINHFTIVLLLGVLVDIS
ncbi:MAG: O-antigen ligase family protein, partial [Planctomycetaceae bacterium]|nr:O-antigen ligase family protein [Planctomycetaceae bacterium]